MQLNEVIQDFFFCSSSFGSSTTAFISCLDLYLLAVEQAHLGFDARIVFSILSLEATLRVITLFLYLPYILSGSLVPAHLLPMLLSLKTRE